MCQHSACWGKKNIETHQEIGSYSKLIGAIVIVLFYSSSSNRGAAICVAYFATLLPSSFTKGRYVTNILIFLCPFSFDYWVCTWLSHADAVTCNITF